ncbi:MAG: NADH:ubiquinone oxidoreductase [Actinophytocola sp.]|uniref:NADH-quinone oxidoreductase subunit B family protein n=1 Tax=Actinophytocola sp. TaxID=1872138 RepID=UPI001321E132|nr:ferredoxin [Actinophytocola sp.]MPZ86099.1 NADH:ubiquinone oxidoreductase [Actinophytocola sp.]
MPWVFRGLRNGVLTTRYPRRPDAYAEHGVRNLARPVAGAVWRDGLEDLCPTGAIGQAHGEVRVDQGRCIGCGACVSARPETFGWQTGGDTARLDRRALVVPELAETDDELARLRAGLARRTRALRRSVHIRHVDAGSDGSEEWEVLALLNPVYDIHRLGIFFTASPRHADILLVTGAGSHGMTAPLARTLEGMPVPLVVIAAGTDAISGGLVSPSYATAGGVGDLLPVDVWVPGSPPSPFSLLHALLLATGRLRSGARRSA